MKISVLEAQWISRKLILKSILEAREYVSGRLLDLGCGKKPYYPYLADKTLSWIGLDFPASVSGSTSADVYGDAMEMPFKSEVFNTILCTEVLEHVSEPNKLLSEAFRVLKVGGYLILTTPQTGGLHEEPHDYYRYTKYGLSFLAEQCGFTVVYI